VNFINYWRRGNAVWKTGENDIVDKNKGRFKGEGGFCCGTGDNNKNEGLTD